VTPSLPRSQEAFAKHKQTQIFLAGRFWSLDVVQTIVLTMSKGDQLIDDHVSLQQCRKAVEALHSHELKKKEKFDEGQLLPGKEQNLWLNVTVKTIPPGHRLKPVKMYVAGVSLGWK
jgi:hypothetical protein